MISELLFAMALRRRVAAEEEEGGGGGEEPPVDLTPTAPPSSLSVYSYSANTRFGIQWAMGDATCSFELFRDGVFYSSVGIGVSSRDIGIKAGDGTHSWKCRALKNSTYSTFSAEITTTHGVQI